MHQQPQENSQSSNRWSFISVWFYHLNWVGVIATTLGVVAVFIPAVRTQLIVKPKQKFATKNNQIQLQQPLKLLPIIETKNNISQSQQPQTPKENAIPFAEEVIPFNQIFAPVNFLNNQGELSKIPPPKTSLPPLTNSQSLIPKPYSQPQVAPAFPEPILLLAQNNSFNLAQQQSASQNQTDNQIINQTNPRINPPINQQINPPINQTPNTQEIGIKLADIVVLVLANNRTIKNAYLDRIIQRKDLQVVENKFAPNFTPSLSFRIDQLGADGITSGNPGLDLDTQVSVKIPTGADVSLGWTNNNRLSNLNDNGSTQNLSLGFRQPLLRGAGTQINKADIKTARLNEQINIIALKSTLSETITSGILAYRELLQAQERLKIQQLALKNAEESLEITQALINAGREAPIAIIQNQASVANQQVSLLAAQNQLESRKLALLQILDIDNNTKIFAAELPTIKPTNLEFNNLKEIALKNQPNYLQSQLNLERSKIEVLLADNDKRWDLNLNVSLNNATNISTDVRTGISLSRTFGDLSREQRPERSRIDLRKAEISLEDSRSSLELELTDRIRDVNLSFSQVQLARQATKLSERQLDIEQQKQKLGRGSGIFQIIQQQTALVEARNAELDATINYLNSLTNLDLLLGTTLNTWQVTIQN
ncbi:TolC family protein [Nostoc sp. CHAB 5836]|uniref:TolC family protein n=1 Tax=Nostoc sp. CHAB 5836 TaxID=2780404 RepID=UPI001E3ABF98|nr:TolC family protein [Nostoc sp. CHAB 5836]MCC5615622.1 TolC family protein [Nostoc sp. CHAB 5836]